MAKKIYHIPLQNVKEFINQNRNIKNKLNSNKELKELYTILGKTHYLVEVEKYLKFIHIQNTPQKALQTIAYFQNKTFVEQLCTTLNLQSNMFYPLSYELHKSNPELFELFFNKIFTHFYISLKNTTPIKIDHINIAKALAKQRKLLLKESFGESEGKSYFKIVVDNEPIINLQGNSIKTLRKKAYKKLTYFLLDFEESEDEGNVYNTLHDMRMM